MDTRLERNDFVRMLPFMGMLLIWNALCWQLPFFWDNILNSRIAQWYLETSFNQLVVPESMDAGHPPFFSLYLALIWKVCGASLAAAHLAMLPFLLGTQILSYKIAKRFLPPQAAAWALLIPFLEPALLAQSAQVTPDIALLCFYLLALVALFEGNRKLLLLAMVMMGAMSFRGILACSALFCTDVALAWIDGKRRPAWNKLWPYIGAALMVLAWLSYHQQIAGWLLTPPEETYGGHRKGAGIPGALRNTGITVWRLLDHGRIWLFAFLGIALTRMYLRKALKPDHWRLIAMAALPVICLSVLFIPFTNPIGHRYFLVAYLLSGILGLRLLLDLYNRKSRWLIGGLLSIGLLTGHLWVYPDTVAKGWDASLAHLPYHQLRSQAVAYMEKAGITRHEVCSDFPMLSAESHLDPSATGTLRFLPKPDTLGDCNYVFYSNISNGFSDDEITQLQDTLQWKPVFAAGSWPVRVLLFRRQPAN